MSTLGERIKEARRAKGWSQGMLAREIGSTTAAVSRWEVNNRVPYATHIYAIASATGVNYRWLNSGEGDMFGEGEEAETQTEEQIINKLTKGEMKVLEEFVTLSKADRQNIRVYLADRIEKIKTRKKEGE